MENPKDAVISTTLSNAFIPKIVMNGLKASGLKAFAYDELLKRDKVNLDIFWLRDESLEDSANLPDPHVLALETLSSDCFDIVDR